MKILFLTDNKISQPLIDFIKRDNEVIFTEEEGIPPDLVISYNYRTIIKKDMIDRYKGRIINLHISYLPYNRGADPIFWSIVERTPSGVTIHQVDEGIDTGDILLQQEVELSDYDTLNTAYTKLHESIQILFMDNWKYIASGVLVPQRQVGRGTYHRKSDFYSLQVGVLKRIR